MKIKFIAIITAVALMAGMTPAKANDGKVIVTTIFGAAAGGLLGSQVGKGDGRLLATATGAVLGAAIGRELGSPNDPYYDEPVVYNPPRKERYSYGNRNAQPVQKTVIIEKKVVKHVIVHKHEPAYGNKRKNKHKKIHWKKRKHQKRYYDEVEYEYEDEYEYEYEYECDEYRNKCWIDD